MNRLEMTRRPAYELEAEPRVNGGLSKPTSASGSFNAAPASQKSILIIAWRGRWLILAGIVLGLVGGAFYLSRQTPIYSSSSRVLVEQGAVRLPGTSIDANQSMTGNFLNTQCELIKSAQILSSVTALPELASMKTFEGADNPLGILKLSLTAESGLKDDLITVSFESPYPAEAASVVNAVVESYRAYYAARRKTSAADVLRILTDEKRTRDKELSDLTGKLVAFKREHPNLSMIGEKGNLLVDQLGAMAEALSKVQLEVLQMQGQYENAKAVANDPQKMDQWLRVQEASGLSPLQSEIQRLEIEMTNLRFKYGEANERVKASETQLEAMRSKQGQVGRANFQAQLAALESALNDAKRRESTLRTNYESQKQAAIDTNSQSAELATIQVEYDRAAKLCDLLDSRIKEVQLTERSDPTTVTVLEAARASMLPIKPKHSVVLFQALLVGLLAGGGLAYLRDWMDQRITSVDEVESRLGLTVLGVLPHMSGRENASVRGQKVQLEPMSDIAEAYRSIRTAIYFGAPNAQMRTILVTSPAPGDGKTTTTSNLAIAMAQAGQRVLLVDCDFRKPMQQKIFQIEDSVGLSNVVAGQASLAKAVKPTGTKGLYILPSGPTPANPSEILNGRTFATVLAKLKDKFDHIVIDSPPVMPVTDARILGASADVTIMVVRAMKSTRRLSEQATQSLISVGSRMLGVIVNDAPRRRSLYGYYQYGGYRYGGYGYGYGRPGPKTLEGKTNGARLPVPADRVNGA